MPDHQQLDYNMLGHQQLDCNMPGHQQLDCKYSKGAFMYSNADPCKITLLLRPFDFQVTATVA